MPDGVIARPLAAREGNDRADEVFRDSRQVAGTRCSLLFNQRGG